MKKLLTCLLCVCLLTVSAFADMLWEPNGDGAAAEFYDSHDTDYEDRRYLCDSYDGTVTAYASPEDLTVLETFQNGETLKIYNIWHGENLDWGLYAYWVDGTENIGWVPMDELALVYDNESFWGDYSAEITDYDGNYDDVTSGYLWTYPHSGALSESEPLDLDPDYMEAFPFDFAYVDADGAVWCYIGYYMTSSGWMCVTDPLNANIPAVEVTQVSSHSQQNGGDSVSAPAESAEASSESAEAETETASAAASAPDTQSLELVVALVIAVVAVTALMIAIFYKRKH